MTCLSKQFINQVFKVVLSSKYHISPGCCNSDMSPALFTQCLHYLGLWKINALSILLQNKCPANKISALFSSFSNIDNSDCSRSRYRPKFQDEIVILPHLCSLKQRSCYKCVFCHQLPLLFIGCLSFVFFVLMTVSWSLFLLHASVSD